MKSQDLHIHTSLYQAEQELLRKYGEKFPALVTPKRNFTYKEILARIGITADLGDTPVGYLNLHPEDFIVEEIDLEGNTHTIEPEVSIVPISENENDKTLYADLVKVGLSTIEAVQGLAHALEISEKQITYGGIKDKGAITSQQVAIRYADRENINALSVPALFLKNFRYGKGMLEKGKIKGNRFVITIRTEKSVDEGWLKEKINAFSGTPPQGGFYNFYYLQRFGSPRLLSHILGGLLLKQDYRKVLETVMCENGTHDVPLVRQLREKARRQFGNWEAMREIYEHLPYTFRQELFLIEYLKEHPLDFLGALKTIKEQTTLWVYAYASYLFNTHLSKIIMGGQNIPERLPLLLHPDALEISTYKDALEKNNIKDLSRSLVPLFGYNPIDSKNTCATKAEAKVTGYKILDKVLVLSFELPQGSYATTFLAHLFEIYRGLPFPSWLETTQFDAKEILGIGSVESVRSILGKYMFSLTDKAGPSEGE